MLALCANAARTACGGGWRFEPVQQPVAVSARLLWAPDPGPMRLVTSIRKRGRRISVSSTSSSPRATRGAVHAVVTLGEPEHLPPEGGAKPLLSANPAVGLMAPNRPTNPDRSPPATGWPVGEPPEGCGAEG